MPRGHLREGPLPGSQNANPGEESTPRSASSSPPHRRAERSQGRPRRGPRSRLPARTRDSNPRCVSHAASSRPYTRPDKASQAPSRGQWSRPMLIPALCPVPSLSPLPATLARARPAPGPARNPPPSAAPRQHQAAQATSQERTRGRISRACSSAIPEPHGMAVPRTRDPEPHLSLLRDLHRHLDAARSRKERK